MESSVSVMTVGSGSEGAAALDFSDGASDLAQARQSALLKRHGYPVNVSAE